ncbi:hypothetical protein [Mucilaginibacter sp. PPCGB 2223]|nr:hypothetical protein [Mucilaginibacter sp. PPCGB 2223]
MAQPIFLQWRFWQVTPATYCGEPATHGMVSVTGKQSSVFPAY